MGGGSGEERRSRGGEPRSVASLSGEGLPADVLAVLEERARDLAGADGRAAGVATGSAYLFFTRKPLRLAVPADAVVRLLGAPRVARIPCAPSLVGRVVHTDGRIVSVVDPTELLGVARPSAEGVDSVLLIEHRSTWLGLYADEVEGLRPVAEQAIAPPSETRGAVHPAVIGTGPGMTLFLDPRWLVEELKTRGGDER